MPREAHHVDQLSPGHRAKHELRRREDSRRLSAAAALRALHTSANPSNEELAEALLAIARHLGLIE